MAKISVYAFDSYKPFLRASLSKQQDDSHLNMATLARKTGYQRSFFSRVLGGELHLTTEGIYKVSKVLGLSEDEKEYFFWLVERERASDPEYRNHAKSRAAHLRRTHEESQKAAATPVKVEEDYFVSYFSSWIWTAIHLATSVSELQLPEKMAEKFGLPKDQVVSILDHLEKLGFVEKMRGSYIYRKGSVHISSDSPWVYFHHSNWRQKALFDVQSRKKESLHFTNVLTLTRNDRDLIRNQLLESIEKAMKIAQPSQPSELVCFNLDFFEI